jgi:hypothetical protein
LFCITVIVIGSAGSAISCDIFYTLDFHSPCPITPLHSLGTMKKIFRSRALKSVYFLGLVDHNSDVASVSGVEDLEVNLYVYLIKECGVR